MTLLVSRTPSPHSPPDCTPHIWGDLIFPARVSRCHPMSHVQVSLLRWKHLCTATLWHGVTVDIVNCHRVSMTTGHLILITSSSFVWPRGLYVFKEQWPTVLRRGNLFNLIKVIKQSECRDSLVTEYCFAETLQKLSLQPQWSDCC